MVPAALCRSQVGAHVEAWLHSMLPGNASTTVASRQTLMQDFQANYNKQKSIRSIPCKAQPVSDATALFLSRSDAYPYLSSTVLDWHNARLALEDGGKNKLPV